MITENSIHIKIKNHKGTWRVIATTIYQDKKIFQIEREQPGHMTDTMVVDEDGKRVEVG